MNARPCHPDCMEAISIIKSDSKWEKVTEEAMDVVHEMESDSGSDEDA